MEKKRLQKLSITALFISILPLATFIPVALDITLSDGMRSVWAGINIFSVFVGMLLSIICVKGHDSRSVINIASTIISIVWVLLMGSIVILALLLNFVH